MAAARTEQLARAYQRRGFRLDPQHPPALVRRHVPSLQPSD
ncbi:hypothetical protein [Streptomyces sp. NBC_01431]|nr:hypothetical protein [Streptomyces sp. NBC_01431]